MNPNFFSAVRARYNLPAIERAQNVAGGLSHQLMRLECADESFALKLLSPRAVRDAAGRATFERAEEVAMRAARAGVPTVEARRGSDGNFVQEINSEESEESGARSVIIYPWCEGEILPPSAAAPAVCAQMGAILGDLHAAHIRFDDQSAPTPEAFADGHFALLLEQGREHNALWCLQVHDALEQLEIINRRARDAQAELRENWVTGHLDFDQKNVLWHAGAPLVLDWESAKPIHPALEAMGAGLSWAGQSAGQTNRDSLRAFFAGYAQNNPLAPADIARASEGVLGKWLIWLEFNLRRSLEPTLRGTPEESICHDALFHALHTTLQLADDAPLYSDWLSS